MFLISFRCAFNVEWFCYKTFIHLLRVKRSELLKKKKFPGRWALVLDCCRQLMKILQLQLAWSSLQSLRRTERINGHWFMLPRYFMDHPKFSCLMRNDWTWNPREGRYVHLQLQTYSQVASSHHLGHEVQQIQADSKENLSLPDYCNSVKAFLKSNASCLVHFMYIVLIWVCPRFSRIPL